jgi:lipoate-protein ligase A
MATAIEGFGLPAAALRDGAVQTARLRTRRAVLTHVAVRVTPAPGTRYIAPGHGASAGPGASAGAGSPARPGSLVGHGLALTVEAVRSALLSAAVEAYGVACTRRPNAIEIACRDHLYAVRYGDFSWHLTGPPVRRGACWEHIFR